MYTQGQDLIFSNLNLPPKLLKRGKQGHACLDAEVTVVMLEKGADVAPGAAQVSDAAV